MISDNSVNIWFHTKNSLYPLYRQRVCEQTPEMDCHLQAAQIYAPHYQPSDRILDAAGGSGYFYHSLARRKLLGDYYLLDQTEDFVQMGLNALNRELPSDNFIHGSLAEVSGEYEVIFCINALFCLPDYRQSLENLLQRGPKIFILRTTLGTTTQIRYQKDEYLDPSAKNLKSYFNIWNKTEVADFIKQQGFEVSQVKDKRCGDLGEMSAGKFFPWTWLVCLKK